MLRQLTSLEDIANKEGAVKSSSEMQGSLQYEVLMFIFRMQLFGRL